MKKVGIRELKNRISAYVSRAQKGEVIVVTQRGEPVAELGPTAKKKPAGKSLEEILQELAGQGHLRLATSRLAPVKPVPARGKPASQMIIEDRR